MNTVWSLPHTNWAAHPSRIYMLPGGPFWWGWVKWIQMIDLDAIWSLKQSMIKHTNDSLIYDLWIYLVHLKISIIWPIIWPKWYCKASWNIRSCHGHLATEGPSGYVNGGKSVVFFDQIINWYIWYRYIIYIIYAVVSKYFFNVFDPDVGVIRIDSQQVVIFDIAHDRPPSDV